MQRQPIHVKEHQSPQGENRGRKDAGADEREPKRGEAARERRSTHRVADDQGSGHGAMSALAKMKMIERRRGIVRPREGDDAAIDAA
jgi:hypothetical protein